MKLLFQSSKLIRRFSSGNSLELVKQKCPEIAGCWSFILDFIDEKEEKVLLDDLDRLLKKHTWQMSHFDSAIVNYRELSISNLNKAPSLKAVVESKVVPIFQKFGKTMLPIHVLELGPGGLIRPHIDNPEVYSATTFSLIQPMNLVFREFHYGIVSCR